VNYSSVITGCENGKEVPSISVDKLEYGEDEDYETKGEDKVFGDSREA
jgi:hypothetical protein